ncbi:MAG: SOUL family heme-binding protein, partial [Halioglobus sp.]
LRAYAPSIQARTPMAVEGESSSTFRRLANYIFGGNAQEQSIAMTAPVETRRAEDGYMAFTMPGQYRMEDLPAPLDDTVTLHAVPNRTLAAISFGGWATESRVEHHTETLLQTLGNNGIETIGPPSLNQYNPPWTPPWSRRNEVVIQVLP